MTGMRSLTLTALAIVSCTAAPCAAVLHHRTQRNWDVVKTFPIGGEGGWDYLTVDPQTHLLYVPRTTHTLVIDGETGRIVADITGQINAHGVAIAPRAGRGFISDGGGNGGGNGGIVVFDLKTNAVLGTLAAMPDTDGIIFDSHSGLILAVSGRGKALMSFKPDIDPRNGKIGQPLPLRGEPEFLAAGERGHVYVNLMDTNEVAVVDLKARKVTAHWPVAPGGAPVGMAIDTKKGHLFIGCRAPQKLIEMSTKDGHVAAEFPIGPSVDAIKYDRGEAFASTGGAQFYVLREAASGKLEMVQTLKTAEGARTMGLDPTTRRIYLPAAEYETGANGRRTMKAGSFMILVLSPRL